MFTTNTSRCRSGELQCALRALLSDQTDILFTVDKQNWKQFSLLTGHVLGERRFQKGFEPVQQISNRCNSENSLKPSRLFAWDARLVWSSHRENDRASARTLDVSVKVIFAGKSVLSADIEFNVEQVSLASTSNTILPSSAKMLFSHQR